MDLAFDRSSLVAIGGCLGALVIVIWFSALVAMAYRDRGLVMHAVASLFGAFSIQELSRPHAGPIDAALLMVLAATALQLHEMVAHAVALRPRRRWLLAAAAACVLAAGVARWSGAWALPLGLALAALAMGMVIARAWVQCLPWIGTAITGYLCLGAACALVAWRSANGQPLPTLTVAALLAFWCGSLYMATVWRHRMLNDTRLRLEARKTVDPLTGLSTPLVLNERLRAARSFAKRFGNPSVLLLIHVENLGAIAREFGLDLAEAALVEAAGRIRATLDESDVAARLAHHRVAVLAEGHSAAQAVESLAGRLLVAGLSQPLAVAPAEFLHFRIVLTAVPTEEPLLGNLLQRLSQRMETELAQASTRRIVALAE